MIPLEQNRDIVLIEKYSDKDNDPPDGKSLHIDVMRYDKIVKFRWFVCAIICNAVQIPFYIYVPQYNMDPNISHGLHHILGYLSVWFYYLAIDQMYGPSN